MIISSFANGGKWNPGVQTKAIFLTLKKWIVSHLHITVHFILIINVLECAVLFNSFWLIGCQETLLGLW